MNTVRWMTCFAISLAGHLLWLNRTAVIPAIEPSQPVVPVTVSSIEPAPVLPDQVVPPQSVSPDTPQEESATASTAARFRPNTESKSEESGPAAESGQEGSEDVPQRESTEILEAPAEQTFSPQQRKEAIRQYRDQLLGTFEDQWQVVPQLNTWIADTALIPQIDDHFGIVVLAYSYVDHKPGPPFLLFNLHDGSSQKIDTFDFTGYSNRIKDRMLYAQYRTWLDNGRRQHNIDSLMKIIGLVQPQVDHYFSAKQLRAVQLAGMALAEARATEAHYEPDGTGGFNLIVDTVTSASGRVVHIEDEELKLSAVTRQ